MKTITTWLLAGTLGVGMSAGALANEGTAEHATTAETEGGTAHHAMTMSELPKPVQDTLQREAQGAKVEHIRKELRKDGSTVYQAKIVKNGKATGIEVNSDGMVVDRGNAHEQHTGTGTEPETR